VHLALTLLMVSEDHLGALTGVYLGLDIGDKVGD
jgi:hypothetical protein